mmetsp:Transcript_20077/g.55268  ORF Transcript_20077/g.55268 Transcript_20077/m.55268 type:complete len:272 (+) Transcript_20077:590-1405(+)
MADHPDIQHGQLDQIPCQICTDRVVYVICLSGAHGLWRRGVGVGCPEPGRGLEVLQKIRWRGRSNLEAEDRKHRDLHVHDLLLGIGVGGNIDEISQPRGLYLFELRCNQQGCNPHQLEPLPRHLCMREVAVREVDGKEQGLPPKRVLPVNFKQPVIQDCSHLGIDLGLPLHVIRHRHKVQLTLEHRPHHIGGVLPDQLRVGVRMRRGAVPGPLPLYAGCKHRGSIRDVHQSWPQLGHARLDQFRASLAWRLGCGPEPSLRFGGVHKHLGQR